MKRRKSFKELAIAVFSLILIVSFFQSDLQMNNTVHAANDTDEDYKIVGYYPSWGAYGRDFQVADMDANKMTHINYAFADICWEGKHGNPDPEGPNPETWSCEDETGVINAPNGTIVLGDPWIDVQKTFPGDEWGDPIKGNLNQLMQLKDINPDLKTIISIGGWSWSNRFSDVAADPTYRENFANSAVDFIRTYNMDGVDLDWEYPVEGGLPGNSVRPDDGKNHTLLLQAVRDKLDEAEIEDNKEYYLTIASNASPEYVEHNEMEKIGDILDWINIMAYDFNGGWQEISAHNAPLYFDQKAEDNGVPNAKAFNVDAAVQGHLDAGVSSNKVVLGTPFYGRGWGGCDGTINGEYQECAGVITEGTWEDGIFDYSDLAVNYINKNGYIRHWNDVAKVPYLYNEENGNFISYDDAESFGHKIDFIKNKGLGGAMFWDYSSDREEVLLDTLNDNLTGSVIVDDEAPTVPANLETTDVTSKSIQLTWDASTDNVGVSSYLVSYGSETKEVLEPEALIDGLSPETAYTFTVIAKDAAGNVSDVSKELTITTLESSDSIAPTKPTDLEVIEKTASSVTLTWTASTDNVGVTGYNVSYGDKNVIVEDTTITIDNLTSDTLYTFSVTAMDAEENQSDASSIEVTTKEASVCKGLEWEENIVYTGGNKVTYDGKLFEAKWWTQAEQPDLAASTSPWEYIQDCNTNDDNDEGNDNGDGNEDDTEAPSIPANVTTKDVTKNGVTLSWDASTDNEGVIGYVVSYGSKTVETDKTTITINELDEATSYTFSVQAKDAAGNTSDASDSVTIKTESTSNGDNCSVEEWNAGDTYTDGDQVSYKGNIFEAKWWTQGDEPNESNEWGVWKLIEDCEEDDGDGDGNEEDTEAPTIPENVEVTNKTATTVTLGWDASTDNIEVVGYEVYDGSSSVASVTNTNARITGLSAETEYTFTVTAVDEAGNESEVSSPVTVTTNTGDDPTPPTGDKMYVSYASTWNTSIDDLVTENIPNYITHLNLSFVRPNTAYEKGSFEFDQEITGFEFAEGAETPNGQEKFTEEEKTVLLDNIDALNTRGTEVWLSVGGWSYSQGSQWDDFNAKNIVDLALDLGASGVDIDWESSGSTCNKATADSFSCSEDDDVAAIITSLDNEIKSRNADLGISIAGWSTGAYYVKDTPFEEGKVQWGSPYGGTMYNLVKNHGDKLDFINLMGYDGGVYYDPREGYESYRAIYDGPINVGLQIAPEGSGGAVLKLNAEPGTVYDAEVLDGINGDATQYYNVETLVEYVLNKGQENDGFMLWQLWKQRVHQPAPEGAATENSAGQYICENLPLAGNCSQTIPDLPKITP